MAIISFTSLRLLAACLVIIGHAHDLQNQSDIAKRTIGFSFGYLGVFAFFALSGYLIYSSALRNPDIWRFTKARLRRIVPGLWVMLLVTTAILAVAYSFDAGAGIKYALCNATVFLSCYDLPAAYASNPSSAVNGSLWTLKFEALCYIGVGLLIATGLLRSGAVLPALVGAFLLFFLVPSPHQQVVHLHQLGGFFLLGCIIARFAPAGRPPEKDVPDISYGVYIYAFPIQQGIIATLGLMHPMLHAALALSLTVIPATLSWFLVEKPALTARIRPVRKISEPV
jgi:peptidoglycan/LPS O-acetylase OafA/YrhL